MSTFCLTKKTPVGKESRSYSRSHSAFATYPFLHISHVVTMLSLAFSRTLLPIFNLLLSTFFTPHLFSTLTFPPFLLSIIARRISYRVVLTHWTYCSLLSYSWLILLSLSVKISLHSCLSHQSQILRYDHSHTRFTCSADCRTPDT